jgi:hypothetical protein
VVFASACGPGSWKLFIYMKSISNICSTCIMPPLVNLCNGPDYSLCVQMQEAYGRKYAPGGGGDAAGVPGGGLAPSGVPGGGDAAAVAGGGLGTPGQQQEPEFAIAQKLIWPLMDIPAHTLLFKRTRGGWLEPAGQLPAQWEVNVISKSNQRGGEPDVGDLPCTT